MKVLVLVEDYPSDLSHALMYVHVRNKYYVNNDIDVTVLNFRAKNDYVYDGINVITCDSYKNRAVDYDLLICHAANIKHHYVFLNKYEKRFKRIIFFYHGHEILKLSEVYPKDYSWIRQSFLKKVLRDFYDEFKFALWHRKLKKIIDKSQLVFVSNWIYHRFLYYIHINPKLLENRVHIINNSVGEMFELNNYDVKCQKEYDFITIRGSSLDKAKYGVDIVTDLANSNPNYKFLVVGKGKFYNYVKQPANVEFLDESLKHDEIITYLNKSRCALLPTRQDTQGVMTCEVATYGIPTITSDIEVCREIFDGFPNVKLITNTGNMKLDRVFNELCIKKQYSKNKKYFASNTIAKEVDLIKGKQW